MSTTRTPALGFLMAAVVAVSALTGTVLYGVYRAGAFSQPTMSTNSEGR